MKFRKFLFLTVFVLLITGLSNAAFASVRLGVMRFTSKNDSISSYQAEAAGDVFVRILVNKANRRISVLEREQLADLVAEHGLTMSGFVNPDKAVQFGQMAGCQYMLMGAVTNLRSKQSSVNLPFTISLGVREQSATATLEIRIVDVETSEIIAAFTETGQGKQSGTSVGVWGVTVDNDELSGMEADAIAKAAEKLAPQVIKALSRSSVDDDFEDMRLSSSRRRTSNNSSNSSRSSRTTRAPRPSSISRKKYQENENYDDEEEEEYEDDNNSNSGGYENYSEDPEDVIPTYGLDEKKEENLINAHKRFWKSSNKRSAYERFSSLFDDNNQDYLAAYRAGLLAQQLNNKEYALAWFDKALEINPDYEPAQKAKSKLERSSSSKSSSSKRNTKNKKRR